jgi:arylsulfatase A-like enzyme
MRILKATHQDRNTLVVFVSDNGWLQGQHRIPGDKFLPYEESLRVPFILRGPGIPAGGTVRGQVSNIDFAATLLDVARARPGRTLDGISLMPAVRNPKRPTNRIIEIEAPRPLFEQPVPIMAWDRPYKGVRTDRYTYVVYSETGDQELYDRLKDPSEMNSVAADPAYAKIKAGLQAKLVQLDRCRGHSCHLTP